MKDTSMDWANASAGHSLDKEEWQGWERASLGKAVRSLCAAGILHQGLEYGCPSCHHNVWLPIAELGPIIVCEICGRKKPAPVDRPWQFRLNGFLRDALRRHGIGPLFWALGRMQRMNSHRTHSFWFEGPLKIYHTKADFDAHRVSTDIDLTVIQGGVVRMCEVKQSARHLAPDALAETFKRLRPDIATIAIMEPATSAIRAKYARFTAAIAGSGIEPELLTFDPDRDLEDRAFLGQLETVRVL